MSTPTLFIDRDGTLIEEPPDAQVDHLSKVRFMPGVFPPCSQLTERGFRFVMVTNQDGLGSLSLSARAAFRTCQDFMLEVVPLPGHRLSRPCSSVRTGSATAATAASPRLGLLESYLEDASDRS